MASKSPGEGYQLRASVFCLLILAGTACAQEIGAISTASGGIAASGAKPTFFAGFGTVNGLGLGTPPSGTTLYTSGVSGGVLYTSPLTFQIAGGGGGNPAVVAAYVSTNFSHSSVLSAEICYPTCASAGNYTVISNSSGSPTTVIGQPGVQNGNYTVYLGVFVSSGDGAAYISGTDSATISFNVYNGSNMQLQHVETLTLNTPNENVQTAVQLQLATAGGGVTITAGSDFTAAFGSVNGLGVGVPATGLTVSAVTGGVVYGSPYSLQPKFSTFASTTATLSTYVGTNFAHSSTLALRDSSSSGGTYTNISTTGASPTAITSSATSGSTTTRYLGLYVSSANGASAFPGSGSSADSATLTFTMTVP